MHFMLLDKAVQAWILSNIVVYDNVSKLLHEWIGGSIGFHVYENSIDKALLVKTDGRVYVAYQGTKNIFAWISNLEFWHKNGFHSGISKSTENIFRPIIKNIPHDKPILLCGQSRGASMSLYSNLMLRRIGVYGYVESIGFSGPYIAAKGSGVNELERLHVVHTGYETDASGPIHSDPVDDVGTLWGKHYGKRIVLDGSGGIFDHSYKSITKNLIVHYEQDNENNKNELNIQALLKILEDLAIK